MAPWLASLCDACQHAGLLQGIWGLDRTLNTTLVLIETFVEIRRHAGAICKASD